MHILQFKALFEIYKEKKNVDKSATKYFHNNTICIEYRSAITQHHNKGDLH